MAETMEQRAERERQYQKRYRQRNKERAKEYMREWRAANRARLIEKAKEQYSKRTEEQKRRTRETSKKWAIRNKDHLRDAWLRREYGITIDCYNKMFEKQGGLCAICKRPNPDKKRSFHVDHDHATGFVRGLLCGHCNTALGLLGESPRRLLVAVQYLQNAISESARMQFKVISNG